MEEWFFGVPIVTRIYASIICFIAIACKINWISPFHLYFNYSHIIYKKQFWRLVTPFLYFGSFGFDFLFYLFFLSRYSRMLEEGVFRGRTADFVWMLLLGAVCMLAIAPFLRLLFLGTSLTFMMVYIWSRRNPGVRLNFLGLIPFEAPYLPYALLIFSMLINNHIPTSDIIGISVGHLYWFLDEICRSKVVRAPEFFKRIIGDEIIAAEIEN